MTPACWEKAPSLANKGISGTPVAGRVGVKGFRMGKTGEVGPVPFGYMGMLPGYLRRNNGHQEGSTIWILFHALEIRFVLAVVGAEGLQQLDTFLFKHLPRLSIQPWRALVRVRSVGNLVLPPVWKGM
jgi:hypothetical protein